MEKRLYLIPAMVMLLGFVACGAPKQVTEDKPDRVTTAVTKESEDIKTPETEPAITPEVTEEPVIEPNVVPTAEPVVTSEPTAMPAPTSTPEPTTTLEPTSTPEPTATPVPTNTPEPTVTPAPTATVVPTATPTPTKKPDPTPTLIVVPEKKDTRFEDGMAKVMKLIDAYDDLIKNGGACESFIQTDLELLTDYAFVKLDLKTADGKSLTGNNICYIAGAMYYYNYVNKNTGFYDIDEWIKTQKNSLAINDMALKDISNGTTFDTDDVIMFEAPALIKWFKQAKSIKGYDFTESDEYTISGIKSSYIIKLNVDGDKTCTAVFDKDDNLLNICTSELFDENNYIPSNILN